jgi:cyclopropane fatty-acyl-phospholipid synthase-like methyltransferase
MRKTSNKRELKDIYQGDYVREYLKKPIKRIRNLLRHFDLNKTDVVADFGCGTAMLMELISSEIHHYYGVDFSEEFIEAAKKRTRELGINNATFECSDIVKFCERKKDFFDKAFTLDFSEHVYDEDFHAIYSSIHDSLKPGGKLYIHTPNGDYFIEILKKHGIMKQFEGHVAVRNSGKYIRLLNSIGFKYVDVKFLSHYVAPLSFLHFLSYIPLAGRFFKARLLIECEKD